MGGVNIKTKKEKKNKTLYIQLLINNNIRNTLFNRSDKKIKLHKRNIVHTYSNHSHAF